MCAERRRQMFKQSLPSIEKFAAFLDGNLSQSEMQQFSQLAEHDSALHQLLKASSVVDNTLADYSDSDLQLAPEIVSLDFELPMIPAEGITPLVTLTPEPIDDMLVAAAACADEDVSMFSSDNPDNHLTIGDEIHNDSSHLMPENDGFDNCDDLPGSIPDDL